MNNLGEYRQVLDILEPMMADFKREISKIRAEGASQSDIEEMLDELEIAHARSDNAEGKLVIAVLREAAQPPHPNH